jgi:beta-glucanase (GH16 family)
LGGLLAVRSASWKMWVMILIPYDKPHYLIMNIAVGGAWGGRYGTDESIFPRKMLIYYVRYYELK